MQLSILKSKLFFRFTSPKSKNKRSVSGPALPFQPHECKCCSCFWPLGSMHLFLRFQNVLQGFKLGGVAVIHSLDFLWEKAEGWVEFRLWKLYCSMLINRVCQVINLQWCYPQYQPWWGKKQQSRGNLIEDKENRQIIFAYI